MIAVLALGVWLALFGIWPVAHPAHDLSPMGIADIMLHVVGLATVWTQVRIWMMLNP